MSKKNKDTSGQKFKKKHKTRAKMPVPKPNDEHMPLCSRHGCNRRVSDARKSQCSHCGATTMSYDYDPYMYGMD